MKNEFFNSKRSPEPIGKGVNIILKVIYLKIGDLEGLCARNLKNGERKVSFPGKLIYQRDKLV